MDKKIYIVRHAEAEGQDPQATLTEKGHEQADELANYLSSLDVERIISSPYLRAIETIEPFANRAELKVELDNRLKERVLSTEFFSDWMNKLEATYQDMKLKYEGGESSIEAKKRIVELVDEILANGMSSTVIVAHGGIISLLLNHYDKDFGFEEWKKLSNPDVFVLTVSKENYEYKRLWNS